MNSSRFDRHHVDATFEMEIVVAGKDEHGLPLIEVNMYPVLASGIDSEHLVGSLSTPLEETGLSIADVQRLPLDKGWLTVTANNGGPGVTAGKLEELLGPKAAVLALQVLSEALVSEYINMDLRATPYRSIESENDEFCDTVQAMHADLAARVAAEIERQETRRAFDELMSRAYGR